MEYLIGYYITGLIVSMYFIYYYRLSEKTRHKPSKNDAWLSLFGVWLWPFQIILHFFTRNNHKKNNTEKVKSTDDKIINLFVDITLEYFIKSELGIIQNDMKTYDGTFNEKQFNNIIAELLLIHDELRKEIGRTGCNIVRNNPEKVAQHTIDIINNPEECDPYFRHTIEYLNSDDERVKDIKEKIKNSLENIVNG